MIKIGLLGIAHMHYTSYVNCVKELPDAELTGLTDDNSGSGREAAEKTGIPFFSDRETLLKSDINAVIICSENSTHAENAIASAQAGKHILCEKPLARSVEEGREMIEAAKNFNVKLQAAFPCRFITAVENVKKQLDSGALGRILAIKGTNRGSMPGGWFVEPELSGGGAVMDHTVHVADLMRWFTKSEAKEVYAYIDRRFNDIPCDDCGTLMITFDNDVFATLDPSWSRSKSFPTWGDVTLQILTEKTTVTIDAFKQHINLYSDIKMSHSYEYWGDNMDYKLIKDFIDCIKNDRPPFITGYDGLKAMEIAAGAYRSAETGLPVALPLK